MKVIETDCFPDLDDSVQIGWVVQKVDVDTYTRIVEQEKVAIEQIKSAEIRKKKEELLSAIKVDKAAIAGMLIDQTKKA